MRRLIATVLIGTTFNPLERHRAAEKPKQCDLIVAAFVVSSLLVNSRPAQVVRLCTDGTCSLETLPAFQSRQHARPNCSFRSICEGHPPAPATLVQH